MLQVWLDPGAQTLPWRHFLSYILTLLLYLAEFPSALPMGLAGWWPAVHTLQAQHPQWKSNFCLPRSLHYPRGDVEGSLWFCTLG